MKQPEEPILDPVEFLKRKRSRGKLHIHADLVKRLLDAGFSAYMVWRYLVESLNLDVSRSTVLRFARSLHQGAVAVKPGAANRPDAEAPRSPGDRKSVV